MNMQRDPDKEPLTLWHVVAETDPVAGLVEKPSAPNYRDGRSDIDGLATDTEEMRPKVAVGMELASNREAFGSQS